MKRVLLLFGLALATPAILAQKRPLTLDDIFVDGGPIGRTPQDGKWSPDGKLYTYILRSADGSQGDLWALDPVSGKAEVLIDSATLSRLNPSIDRVITDEREKERLTRYSVAGYLWSPDSRAMLFISAGRLYIVDLTSKQARSFLPSLNDLTDPKFSPDGTWISFVKGGDIWIAPATGGQPRQLTRGGSRNAGVRRTRGDGRDRLCTPRSCVGAGARERRDA